MPVVYNQWKHAGERTDNKVIVSNFGISYNKEMTKRCGGYLVICKCGYGFVCNDLCRIKKGLVKCPYCGR